MVVQRNNFRLALRIERQCFIVVNAVHIGSKPLAKEAVFSRLMGIELAAEFVEANLQLNSLLDRLIRVEGLGNEPVNARQKLRVFGLNSAAFARQSRAARHGLLEASVTFLLGEMMLQFRAYLTQDANNVGARSISIRSMGSNHGLVGLVEHSMQSAMLRNQVVHIATAFFIITHGWSSL
jgi:hypothetical protein